MLETFQKELELYESNGKFYIKGGNNRLSLMMVKYLSELSKAKTDEEREKIDEKYTFVGQINPIPKDRDIMHMINMLRNRYAKQIQICRTAENENWGEKF